MIKNEKIPNNMIKNPNEELSDIFKKYLSMVDDSQPIHDSEFTIPTKTKDTPALAPYTCPQFQETLMKDKIKELLNKKINNRSNSLFAAPCFIKKNMIEQVDY
ncbi:hypothetical protein DMUE_3988 [Dictyocoela muelleri]|nr:hypothetical protein DMUE_3988 [Dictyocoela muelleri]